MKPCNCGVVACVEEPTASSAIERTKRRHIQSTSGHYENFISYSVHDEDDPPRLPAD